MKKHCLLMVALMVCPITYAQNTVSKDSLDNKEDLRIFIDKIIGSQTEVPKASFIFDISKSPELKLNVPLNKDLYNQFYIDSKVASSNDFTPLIKSGDWLPDVGINLNYTKFFSTITKYYTSEINEKYRGKVSEASINDASQLIWTWLNVKVGYNYSTLETYNGDPTLLNKDKFDKNNLNSFLIKTDFNFFFYPSKKKLKFLSFNGKLGYEYKTNDNNYSSLKSINVRDIETITDTNGNTIEVSSDTKKIKRGILAIRNTSNINYNIMALISPSEKFYIGLSTYGKKILTKELEALDIGFGITVPITKNDKTLASLTLKYEIPDINNKLSNFPLKEKGILGFSIGLPINVFGRK